MSAIAASHDADRSGCSILPARIAEILLASLTALAAAGEDERACRLAGEACVALRVADPAASRRFDALLHRLTRDLTW